MRRLFFEPALVVHFRAGFMKGTSMIAAMAVVVLLQFSLATGTAWAQAGFLGGIMGKAADETGGVLPGVTVTATSPALQVPNVTTVTDAEGNYRLRDLPAPGIYRVVFELPGFQTIAFDGVSLTAGFTARIDAAMNVSTCRWVSRHCARWTPTRTTCPSSSPASSAASRRWPRSPSC